ncbi:MAG: hypothetical protein K6E68_08120 [Lachnospiraceae bacterium]|nr:hypothetical protein [Lachnospiraceae bacterium]
MKKKTDEELAAFIAGIVIYGILCQLTVLWFVDDKAGYSMGLWAGIAVACGYASHIRWSLWRNLTINADNERAATAFSLKHSVIRYAAVIVTLLLLWYFGGNTMMLAGFLGIMGAKAGAYIQPIVKKFYDRYIDKEVGL